MLHIKVHNEQFEYQIDHTEGELPAIVTKDLLLEL